MQLFSTQHKVFWVVFLAVVAVCFAFAFSGLQRRDHARRAADLLRPMIASDARFQKVTVALATSGGVLLEGSVASTNDLGVLQRLVEQTQIPSQPVFLVRVVSNPPN